MQDMVNMTTELDLRGGVCPYTFVKTKLKLEELESGEELIVTFDHAPAVEAGLCASRVMRYLFF
jgi:tRNA 2-thiouridine synthesizing protein A